MSDLFARVRPVVGEALANCQVAVVGSAAAGLLVEYLAACGVCHWLVMAENEWMGALVAKLRQRYGPEFDINIQWVDSAEGFKGADVALVLDDVKAACTLPRYLTRLAIFSPTSEQGCRASLALPGETFDFSKWVDAQEYTVDRWNWQTTAPLLSLCVRALLLRGSSYAMPTWEAAWARGKRDYVVGASDDPTSALWVDEAKRLEPALPVFRTPTRRQGTLLIVGLGSLGSVAARHLAPFFERMILADPDDVELPNLVRQAYRYGQIGMAKAVALAESLRLEHPELKCEAFPVALNDELQISALIADCGVTVALVTTGTTGTHADFAIARGLRAAEIPHVVGRCYARARFWEGIVVDGAHGLSYEQVRREVTMGPTPLPTAEEMAAYGAASELAAEAATAMETGWAALWLARLVAQMASPMTLREGWLLARLAAGASCFVGGVVVEPSVELDAKGIAYGIEVPGQVHAWSVAEFA